MTVLLNVGRLAMVIWALYALLLIFVPAFVHRPPDPFGGTIQFVAAYAVGYLLDRLLGVARRRRAQRLEAASPAGGSDTI